MPLRGWIFVILFFCSGATALIYEVVWSKYLSQMFGSTVQAQTAVLAVFMGGLALGNSLFGRKSDRFARPMRAYGFIEISIGLYAVFFNGIYGLADAVFVKAGSPIVERGGLLLALKATLSVALLLGPTVLMGGTLPILAGWLKSNLPDAGRRSALFYSINSLGAAFGAGLAGFYLVRGLGMEVTLQMTGLVNVLIGAIAVVLGKERSSASTVTQAPADATKPLEDNQTSLIGATAVVAITGAISMGLEVLASRSLALIFGSSLQAFAVVLIAFILGIGLGSAWICKRQACDKPLELAIILLLSASTWIAILVLNIENWVEFYRWAMTGVARTATGYTFHHLLTAFMSVVLLGVPAALIGSVLPLQIRACAGGVDALGQSVGRLLTWNTLGAVVGVILTGFFIMPGAGLRNAFGILALLLCAGAGVAAWKTALRKHLAYSAALGVAICTIFPLTGEGWRHVMSSGVFRAREKQVDPVLLKLRKQHVKLLFYEDAPDATVSVEEGDGVLVSKYRNLAINGKTDASTLGDLSTQLLMGHLPMLSRPDAKQIFMLGVGSGITARAVIGHPVERLTIADNCEPVIRAARFFDSWNRGVLTNPVTRVWKEDARTILKLSPQQYDVIILQPSNPWTVGVGSIFSQEFYELVSKRLKPGGLVAQWFHIYDMHDGIVSLVLRTFGQTYRFVEIWDTGSGDLVMLGAHEPWASSPELFQRGFERQLVREDLEQVGVLSPQALFARQLASQRTAFAIPGEGPIQRDHFPILEYEAPKAFFMSENATAICQFDERTAQADTAPAEKRALLRSVNDAELKAIFGKYSTINPEIITHVQVRIGRSQADPSMSGLFLPRGTNSQVPLPETTDPVVREVASANALLHLDGTEKQRGVDKLIELLSTRDPKATWSAGYYAAQAAKATLALGNLEKSAAIVQLGLRLEHNPEHAAQLLYLERVLEREQELNPSRLSSARN